MREQKRLVSLDIFRGITVAAMILVNFPGSWKAMYPPLQHAAWEGTTPTDFIFPFFIFIAGISLVLSATKQLQSGKTRKEILQKSLLRALKIFLTGIFLRVLPTLDFSRIEIPGVLQRIAVVYLVCALLFLYTSQKFQLWLGAGILVTYWMALVLIPVPGVGAGILEPGINLANWTDHLVFPANLLNKKGYDAEGFLSTFPAIVTGISGMFTGRILLSGKQREEIVSRLFYLGTILVFAGIAWSWWFPVIKKIWTSSFVLLTSGWAMICYALLYHLVEVRQRTGWSKPWIVFGCNAIAIYVLADVFETIFLRTGLHDVAWTAMGTTGMNDMSASLAWAIFSVLVCYLAAWILYRRRIFIRL